jgi:hypothetical protein
VTADSEAVQGFVELLKDLRTICANTHPTTGSRSAGSLACPFHGFLGPEGLKGVKVAFP